MRTGIWLVLSVALVSLAVWMHLAVDSPARYEGALRLWSAVIAVIAAWGAIAPTAWLRRPHRNWRYRDPQVPTDLYVAVMRAASILGVLALGIALPIWLTTQLNR